MSIFNRNPRVLITGAKGQLGSYLVDYFKKSNIRSVVGIDIADLDIANPLDIEQFFDKNPKFDYVIHCAAITNTTLIEQNPESSYLANVLGPRNIAEQCAKHNIKLIHISTDYVLSEKSPIVNNNIQEFPVNQYGLQKLLAEQFIKQAYQAKPNNYVILRSSWMYGNSSNSFIEKFLTNCIETYYNSSSAEVHIPVANDAYGRPSPVWVIADKLNDLLNPSVFKQSRVINLQDEYPQISRYDWACFIWNEFLEILDAKLSGSITSTINDYKAKIKVVPEKSSNIGLSKLHHPGLIKDNKKYLDNNFSYFKDTRLYILNNIDKLKFKLIRNCPVV